MTDDPKARAAAKAKRSGQAMARAAFLGGRMGEYDLAALDAALAVVLGAQGLVLSAFPTSDTLRWVPIGPSVSFAEDTEVFPRSTGRVRDIAVNEDGTRAYAATGKGGVWYTEDGGNMWAPVGGWANRSRTAGGLANGQACSSLLVSFQTKVDDDFVMVGTGELAGWGRPNRPALGGLGVLSALGPAKNAGVGGDPWEAGAGQAQFEGLGVFRLARKPGATPGSKAAPTDTVLAATNAGLFLGTRQAAVPGPGDEFGWVELTALGTFFGVPKPIVTDVLWLPFGANGRIVVTVAKDQETVTVPASPGSGVAFSDDSGGNWTWVTGLNPTVAASGNIVGRMSLAIAPATNRLYVLGDRKVGAPKDNKATVWQVPAIDAVLPAVPTATQITGTPALWTFLGRSQRDYDQCIAVDIVGGKDRVFLGGSFVTFGLSRQSSVWCFDVDPGPKFVPAPGVSKAGSPAPPPAGTSGDGAVEPGLIGDNIHPDVHIIRVTGPAGQPRQVWVGCDGGVYVSADNGQVNTYASRATGFAAIEVNFLSAHPTSCHFLAIGTQDNGRHKRLGDVVWQDTVGGDGGGVAIHPNTSNLIVSQTNTIGWVCEPPSGFVNPVRRTAAAPSDRESKLTAFYSGIAVVKKSSTVARLAIGSNRVWLSDNLPDLFGNPNTWKALPFPSGAATDPRPGGGDPGLQQKVGVPGGAPLPVVAAGGRGPLGSVLTMKWWSPTDLLVLFDNGVVHWTHDPVADKWSTKVLVAPAGITLSPAITDAPDPATTTLTDIGPVPGSDDFYLVTTGDKKAPPGDTCLYFDSANNRFFPTDLRHALDPNPGTLGPLDPALAVVVDPAKPNEVYVGTVTGVWMTQRNSPSSHKKWTALVNGLPPAAVQDLGIWVDPAGAGAGKPKLLRAAMQARGMWELEIESGTEPQRTYARVHAHDDRRRLPTPMADPSDTPGINHEVFASPDIMVRPKGSIIAPATGPAWQFGAAGTLGTGLSAPSYELWTFQTAFRWIFPSVAADGRFSDSLSALIEKHNVSLGRSPAPVEIDKTLWDSVVLGTHLDSTGKVTAAAADPLAVFRAPWHTRTTLDAVGNEADLLQRVVYPMVLLDIAQVFTEPCTVDVLIHHRDTRPVNQNKSYAVLMFRYDPSDSTLLGLDVSALPAYVKSVLAADNAATAMPAPPAGWKVAMSSATSGLHRLNARLDARMPRAVPIDVDLTAVAAGNFVLFLAFVGSDADPYLAAPVGLPATPNVTDLVTRWSPAAARLVQVSKRP